MHGERDSDAYGTYHIVRIPVGCYPRCVVNSHLEMNNVFAFLPRDALVHSAVMLQ